MNTLSRILFFVIFGFYEPAIANHIDSIKFLSINEFNVMLKNGQEFNKIIKSQGYTHSLSYDTSKCIFNYKRLEGSKVIVRGQFHPKDTLQGIIDVGSFDDDGEFVLTQENIIYVEFVRHGSWFYYKKNRIVITEDWKNGQIKLN